MRYSVVTLGLILCVIGCAQQPKFEFVTSGNTAVYEFQGTWSQDLSGSAIDNNGNIMFGFDGGLKPENAELRIVKNGELQQPAMPITTPISQMDIEGMTYADGQFFVISSMSEIMQKKNSQHTLSAIRLDSNGNQIMSAYSVDLRQPIRLQLQQHFQSDTWFNRVLLSSPKAGGINIEAIAKTAKTEHLLLGLRSPLWSLDFGAPEANSARSLTKGDAILVEIAQPLSSAPKMTITSIDLNGKGIRGLEYIESLDRYLIIAGPVSKGTEFSLWLYHRPSGWLSQLNIAQFSLLCRPETVLPIEQESAVYLFSEQSGVSCQSNTFSYIKLKYAH